ncbi:phenylacetaldoxime dehydratase family protein [Methylobacterium symbioticum]|jgi:hypothetical protein|uniref:DUF4188 domain-containing protein n=1 Tax=Methylobacterium symbioticum TaxID=2584084 RepID=A0A509EB50_9HYPH|nr:phenylacetaldoxime dehydratase family protein [Methylobacterium symbioticum]VUD71516.1 hypothetical protein MET9862_02098 [Methylobacterium symbioticum]
MNARRVQGWVPDFSGYPDLVVMYLGMRVRSLRGLKTALFFGPPIDKAGAARPDGLLHHENRIVYQFFPFHVGMRWYWRDMESLEAWARTEPHRTWWKRFTQDTHGVGIWHETYHMRGGMEAIYTTADTHPGFGGFMPVMTARGTMASRHRRHASSDLSDLPEPSGPERDAA